MSGTNLKNHTIDGSEMDKITATKKVRNSGHSLVLFITEECKMIDVERGDIVEVTIEKIEDRKVKKND